jgi:hypothetical protein
MGWFLPFLGKTLASAAVAGIAQSASNNAARRETRATYQRNRADYLEDRDEGRAYDLKMRDETRAYNERLSDKEFNRLNDLKAMRARVEDAGLNFASYIKGGGSIAGGGTPFETPRQGASPSAPTMSSANIKQSAGGAAVSTFFNSMMDGGLQEERDRLEVEIMKEELKTMQRDGQALTKKNWGYSIPEAVTTTRVESDANAKDEDGYPSAPAAESDNRRPALFRAFGINYSGSGAFDTGQIIEDEIGDAGSLPFQLGVVGDAVWHTHKIRRQKWAKDFQEFYKQEEMRKVRPRARPPIASGTFKRFYHPQTRHQI